MKKKKLLVGKMKRFKTFFVILVIVIFSGQMAVAQDYELSSIGSGNVEVGVTIWDFSGTYTESRDGMILSYILSQDAKGKLTGFGTFDYSSDNISIDVEIKGKVKGKNNIVKLKYKLKGKDADDNKLKDKVSLELDESSLSLVGIEKIKICAKGAGCEKTEEGVSLDVPDGTTGEAGLSIAAEPNDGIGDACDSCPAEKSKKLEGTGELTLSNGDIYDLSVKGKYNSKKDETKYWLKGADKSTKRIKIKLKIDEGADSATFIRSKAFGQQLDFIATNLTTDCVPDEAFVTGPMPLTSDEVEREYYLKLPSPYNSEISYPLILAFHGFTSDYTSFSEGYYDLQEVVGNEAILVYPNALEINGKTQWDLESDLIFFDDLYAELETNLCFDKRKVFATGHSNGAVFTNTLGCRRGDVLRAIGPVSGIFLENYSDQACIGQVASITMHGDNDTTIPLNSALAGRDYWIAINSCSSEASEPVPGVDPSCIAYADCDPEYTVQFCEYSGDHDWPDFGGEAVWGFFDSLPPAIPSSTPGTGEPPATFGFASIKIQYPVNFVGIPYLISLGLYPSGTSLPLSGSPDKMLTLQGLAAGEYIPGAVKEYNHIPIDLNGVEHGDYALITLVYVEGGDYPVPISEKDYIGLQEITVDSSIIDIETPFELEFIIY